MASEGITTKPIQLISGKLSEGELIYANDVDSADFIYENIQIQTNLIHFAMKSKVKNFLFMASSCIYPRDAVQPIKEEYLLSGYLESSNEPYAIAKIAGIKLCESFNRQYSHSHGIDYRSIMPTNIYGPGDNYHPDNSHVVPALIRRFHEAKRNNFSEVVVWGSGTPMREFLYVEDMADASLFIHNLEQAKYREITKTTLSHNNVGTGVDVTIKKLT